MSIDDSEYVIAIQQAAMALDGVKVSYTMGKEQADKYSDGIVEEEWDRVWVHLAATKHQNRWVRGLDTGAGVVLRSSCKDLPDTLVYLPGHAIIEGKLVSKPMLEPSDQPGVTMGERVEGLNREILRLCGELEQSRANLEQKIAERTTEFTQKIADAEKKARDADQRAHEMDIKFLAEHANLMEANDMIKQLRAELAREGVSLAGDGDDGQLSVSDGEGGLSEIGTFDTGVVDPPPRSFLGKMFGKRS